MCKALQNFLENKNISASEFAELIGCTHATVSRYLAGKRIPDEIRMKKIFAVTHGKVTPNDFYDLPALPEANGKMVAGGSGSAGSLQRSILSGALRVSAGDKAEALPGQIDLFAADTLQEARL